MNPLAICDFDPGQWLVIGPNVGPLQYYSHLPVMALALILAIFVLFSNKKLSGWIFFFTILPFVLWVFFDSIIWATNRSDVIMFMWSLQVLIEPLVYMGCVYLLEVLTTGKDISYRKKLIGFLLFLPLILLTPTKYILSGFDLTLCLANETLLSYYTYFIEIILVFWMLWFANKMSQRGTKEQRTEIFFLTTGIMLFLVAFAWGNIIGSFTGDWQLAQYGLFGMPVFMFFLVYAIVKFRAFNIRLIGAVALVMGLIALTFASLFVEDVTVFRSVAGVTFVLSVFFGFMLIRSVRAEVLARERIELLAQNLQAANERQVTLIHFITHQIKGFVTKSRNIFSMALDGDYGSVSDTLKPMLEQGLASDTQGVNTIQEILNASNIKSGKVSYTMAPFDLKALIEEVAGSLKANADKCGLTLNLNLGEALTVNGDRAQLVNAYKNLIDNSIKYTRQGSVTISLEKKDGKALFTVADTGVGITDEDKKNLFTEGGHGKESMKVNVDSTGFGLYIVKNIIDAHKGRVWAESDGAGKGSRFYIELPL